MCSACSCVVLGSLSIRPAAVVHFRPCELSGRNGKRSMACRAEKLSKEDLIRLAGSKKVAEEALKSEPANETYEIPFEGIPHKPKFAIPNPKRGERFAAYHRESMPITSVLGNLALSQEPTLLSLWLCKIAYNNSGY